jgi:sulfatase modifying factor 1
MKNILFFIALLPSLNGFCQSPKGFLEPSMITVEGGSFTMGSITGIANERPAHTVTLKSFYISKYEITQAIWQSVMESNPSHFKGCSDCPVEQVSWETIQEFISKLNQLSAKHYRLPTEAEWEYAATGGNKSKNYRYSGSNDPAEVAWYKVNAGKKTHPVGQKKPNELGIYDMTGNIWELCSDWYDSDYYKKSPATDPRNDNRSASRVSRGGSWRSMEPRLYNKARNRNVHDHHIANGGIRLVLDH